MSFLFFLAWEKFLFFWRLLFDKTIKSLFFYIYLDD